MRVEVQRLRMTLSFTNLEQIRTGNVQNSFRNQLLHRPLTLIVWIDLDKGFWPIAPICVLSLNFIPDIRSCDPGKTA